MNRFFDALGRAVVRLRWVIVIVWIVGTVAGVSSLPTLASQVDNNNGAFLPASAPSNQAARLAAPLIGSETHGQVPIVAVTSNARLGAADLAAIKEVLARLDTVPSKLSAQFLGTSPDDRAAELLFVSSTSPFDQDKSTTLINDLNSTLSRIALPADLQVHLAGQLATNAASQQQSAKQGKEIQNASILFIIVLLLIIFRSVAGATGHSASRRPGPGPVGVVHRRPGQRGRAQGVVLHADPPDRPDPRGGDRLRALPGLPGA